MNILVTGGAGYIGSHTCKAIASSGHTPITYDNLSRGNRWAVKWGPLEEGNIGDAARLSEVLEKYRPEAVVHFAAYAYVGESVEQPSLYYNNNFCGTAALLRAVLAFRPLPIVFSSTCASYGLPEHMPISEKHPQRPINPYGHSKAFVEQLLRDLNFAHGLPWVALRYFNAAGADADGELGEAHNPETHLIPLAIIAALKGTTLQIFGNDYDTPDGTCVRDYVHVSDLAEAHLLALKYLLLGGESCPFNLANTRGYSVKEVVSATEKVCGQRINVHFAQRRPGDPPILIGDAHRAQTILKWNPSRSDLETQIRDQKNWVESQK